MLATSGLMNSMALPRAAGAADASRGWSVCIICDSPRASTDILEFLRRPFRGELVPRTRLASVVWNDFDAIVVDAWSKTADDIADISALLAALSHVGKPVFLAIGRSLKVLFARSGLLAGINTFMRPLEPEGFTDVLAALLASLATPSELKEKTRRAFVAVPEHAEALIAADEALDRIFALGMNHGAIQMQAIDRASVTIIESLAESGIGSWISGVRQHHDSTYQHCLLVTGAAIAFGQQLGFSRQDLRRIALGALMHDVGKARVPIGILDKPDALTAEEKMIIGRHPQLGLEILAGQPSITDELKSIVLDHHEMLDGSGYPRGLMADSIPDIVRLVTVADIFGALIERRTYKAAMRGADAYEILLSMTGKLDLAIVKAIRTTAFRAES